MKIGALKLSAFELHSCTNEWNSELVGKGLRETLPASTGDIVVSYSSDLQRTLIFSERIELPVPMERRKYKQSLSWAQGAEF